MKRYMVFGADDHYPDGGMHDFIESFDSFEDSLKCLDDYVKSRGGTDYCHSHIFDLHKNKIIKEQR